MLKMKKLWFKMSHLILIKFAEWCVCMSLCVCLWWMIVKNEATFAAVERLI